MIHKKNIWVLFFPLLFCLYALVPRYALMNADSRFSLTKSIVEEGVLNVDKTLDPKTNIDWSQFGDHYYTNKAPGVSFLAVPVYFVFLKLEKLFGIDIPSWRYRNLRWCDVFVTALPSVFLTFLMMFFVLKLEKDSALLRKENIKGVYQRTWLMGVLYSLGTIIFPFSTMLWGHPNAALFLFAAFYLLYFRKSPIAAGLCYGAAVLTEYSCAVSVPAFAYLLLNSKERSRPDFIKRIVQFAAGGLPMLILFMWYHKKCFGGVFALAPQFQNPGLGVETGTKIFGVLALPSPTVCFELLFGIYRGLFMISPILIFSLVGFWNLWKQRERRDLVLFCLWNFVAFVLFNASYNGWGGGASSGPRYLIPMLPFLALGLAWVTPRLPYFILATISLLNLVVIVAVDSTAPDGWALLPHVYGGLFTGDRFVTYFLPTLITVAFLCALAYVGMKNKEPNVLK